MSARLDRLGPDWPHRERSRIVRAGGVNWHVQSFGDAGPRVLLLHGTGASTHSWRDVAPLLAAHARILVPDLPGHGATEQAGGDGMRLPGMARRLGALCEAEDFEPDAIIGHSAGAAVAIAAATEDVLAPRLIVGLNAALRPMQGYALFSPLAKALFVNPLVPSLFARLGARGRTARDLLERTGSRLDARGIELYRRLFANADHVRGALGMMAGWDLEWLQRRLPALRSRLVLVAADDDGTVPARDAAAHVAKVRDGRLVSLSQGGHLVHEVEPRRVVALVLDCMAEAGLPLAAEVPIS